MIPKIGETIYVVERQDEHGTFCLIYNDSTPEGQEATYANLEEAARVLVGYRFKTGEKPRVNVIVDSDEEYARYTTAEKQAEQEFIRAMRARQNVNFNRDSRGRFRGYGEW